MLRVFVILAAFGYCSSRPQFGNPLAQIIEYVNDIGPFGYNFRYSTSDGVGREERGELMYPGTPQETYVVQGLTRWTSPEGIPFVMSFISDNKGYRTSKPEAYQPFVSDQHSVYPSAPVSPSRRAQVKPTTGKPTIRPVKPYVAPSKSVTFGSQEELPVNSQTDSENLQRTAEGVVPVGPPKIGAGTAAALLG